MLKFYKTIDGRIQRLEKEEPGCWAMAGTLKPPVWGKSSWLRRYMCQWQ